MDRTWAKFGARRAAAGVWQTPGAIAFTKINHYINEGFHIPQRAPGQKAPGPLLIMNCAQRAWHQRRHLEVLTAQ